MINRFVVPEAPGTAKAEHVILIGAGNLKHVKFKKVDALLVPYVSSDEYDDMLLRFGSKSPGSRIYGKDLFNEVNRYAEQAKFIAKKTSFDLIHAHDWMTYRAGINAKKISNKPLVIHVHATEFDRTGGHPNQYVYDIEREGMHAADSIVAVSNFTKSLIVKHYGIEPEKVNVVLDLIFLLSNNLI